MIVGVGLERDFVSRSGQRVSALSGLDFVATPGEMVVVCGPSGCGKSTLLNLVGMLDRPSKGRLAIGGVETTDLDPGALAALRRQTIGFLFQDAGLLEPMKVVDNVLLPLVYRRTPRADRLDRAHTVLARVGLETRLQSSVSELSGGERQRVGLARALVSSPRVLICDEPTAALDHDNSIQVARLLQDQAKAGVTVICSSHDPILMDRADRLVPLARGRRASAP